VQRACGGDFAYSGDDRITKLFFRRSGPIAAAIAITIDAPSAAA
jgi:hypothetical protein